jgi:hypothetical protein
MQITLLIRFFVSAFDKISFGVFTTTENDDSKKRTWMECIYLGILCVVCNELYIARFTMYRFERPVAVLIALATMLLSAASSSRFIKERHPKMKYFRVYVETVLILHLLWIPWHIAFVYMWSFPETHPLGSIIRYVYLIFHRVFNLGVVFVVIASGVYVINLVFRLLECFWEIIRPDLGHVDQKQTNKIKP